MRHNALQAYAGELLGTGLLLIAVVGSGITGEQLSGGNVALALMTNILAIGAALVVLIQLFGPLSDAHFNPLVSLAETWEGRLPKSRLTGYLLAQLLGAMLGVFATHAMFSQPVLQHSSHIRTGFPQWFSEAICGFGLMLLVLRRFSLPKNQIPWLIAAYITAAIWFSASYCFVNPTVTLARAFTDTFTGIRLQDVPGFVVAQTLGGVLALVFSKWLDQGQEASHA
jgi:glycerol uptake facilitator-like aquaporin